MRRILLTALIFLVYQNKFSDCGGYDDIYGPVTEKDSENVLDYIDTVVNSPATEKYPTRPTPTSTTTKRTTTRIASTTNSIDVPGRFLSNGYDPAWQSPESCELNQKCVPYFLCKEDGTTNDDGYLLIDERFDGPTKEKIEICSDLDQCCLRVDFLHDVVPNEMCQNPRFTRPKSCGYRNPTGLGGKLYSKQNRTKYSQYAEFPWMMAILVKRNIDNVDTLVYKCGGSLINPKVVMTTAHNIAGVDPKKFVIRGGEWDTQSEKEICKHEDRKVEKIFRHPQFTRNTLQNDIALIVVDTEFEPTPFINTICLPPRGANFDGQRCLSAGWGKDKFGQKGVRQAFLKKVELPVVPNDQCQKKLRKTKMGSDYTLHDELICAGGERGNDLCEGDGGSPLMCENRAKPGYYYQAGIVAGGVECGLHDVPGLYVDVSRYRDWIEEKLVPY